MSPPLVPKRLQESNHSASDSNFHTLIKDPPPTVGKRWSFYFSLSCAPERLTPFDGLRFFLRLCPEPAAPPERRRATGRRSATPAKQQKSCRDVRGFRNDQDAERKSARDREPIHSFNCYACTAKLGPKTQPLISTRQTVPAGSPRLNRMKLWVFIFHSQSWFLSLLAQRRRAASTPPPPTRKRGPH